MYDFNVIINYIGITPYILLICLSTSVFNLWPSGLNNVAPMFLLAVPDHHVNQNWTSNLIATECSATFTNMFNMTGTINYAGIPLEIKQNATDWDRCQGVIETSAVMQTLSGLMPDKENLTDVECEQLFHDISNGLDGEQTGNANNISHGYWFDVHKSGMVKTAATEFEIVCDASGLRSLSTSLYMVGYALGAMIFGNMSDIKGRKYVMRITSLIAFLCDVLIVFSTNFWIFLGARVAVAAAISGCYVATFTYAMEICPPRFRSFTGVNVQGQFAVGYMILGWLSAIPMLHDWHYFSAVIAAFGLLAIGASFYVPESPAWLFAKGRDNEALAICDDIHFRKTGMDAIPDHIVDEAHTPDEADKEVDNKTYTMIDLFRTRHIAVITLNVMYQWLINTMTYYGLLFGAGDLPGSVIFNNTIGGVMEIASQFLLLSLMDRKWCGRKRLLIGLEFIASITCIGCAAMYYPLIRNSMLDSGMTEDDINLYIQICAMVGKFGIAGSFALIYNYTAELYPVVLKSNGVAIGSFAGRIGGVLFPIILDLKDSVGPFLPMAIFGFSALVCTFLSFFFPETLDSPNLVSLEDANNFYQGKHVTHTKEDDENEKFMR